MTPVAAADPADLTAPAVVHWQVERYDAAVFNVRRRVAGDTLCEPRAAFVVLLAARPSTPITCKRCKRARARLISKGV